VIIEESGGLEGEDVEAEPRIYPILFLICPSIFCTVERLVVLAPVPNELPASGFCFLQLILIIHSRLVLNVHSSVTSLGSTLYLSPCKSTKLPSFRSGL